MTTNLPNDPVNSQNTPDATNTLPWQSRVSNQMDPLKMEPPVSTVFPPPPPTVVAPINIEPSQPAQPAQPAQPVQPTQNVLPVQEIKPVQIIEPITNVPELNVNNNTQSPINNVAQPIVLPEATNINSIPITISSQPSVLPTKVEEVVSNPIPVIPTISIPPKNDELPGQSLDSSVLTEKIIPQVNPQPPINTELPKILTPQTQILENKGKVKSIVLIIVSLIAGIAVLVLGIYLISNAT